jgi:hypothetical protein
MARFDDAAEVWAAILSENESEIGRAWQELDAEERAAIIVHLHKMSDPGEGYAEVQQRSAAFALGIVKREAS